jgi:DNA-binding GntR family transcriptional regulator
VTGLETKRVVGSGLADEIAFRLQESIMAGEYAPGERLNQEELCARWGVSRTPLREALRHLQAIHLVELVPNRGATVRIPSRREAEDVYALRAEIEGFACELASRRWDADRDEILGIACDEAQRAVDRIVRDESGEGLDRESHRRLRIANDHVHGAIHAAAGNGTVGAVLQDLQGHFPKDYVWQAVSSPAAAQRVGVDEHREIKELLRVGDGAGARRAMTMHVTRAGEVLLAYLDEHEFWG